MRKMNTAEMLDYLVEAFKRDSVQYADIDTPRDTEGKRRLLRSLMNLRMPAPLDEKTLAVQDTNTSVSVFFSGAYRGPLRMHKRGYLRNAARYQGLNDTRPAAPMRGRTK